MLRQFTSSKTTYRSRNMDDNGPFTTPRRQSLANENTPPSAGFAVLSIDLPPGLPKVSEMKNNSMSPPPHIPFSGNQFFGENSPNTHEPLYNRKSQRKQAPKSARKSFNNLVQTPSPHSAVFATSPSIFKGLSRFQMVNPPSFAPNAVPIRGVQTREGAIKYPLLLGTQEGTILISLSAGVIIEICVDRSFRMIFNNDILAYVNGAGSVSTILHKYAKIVHSKEFVHCKFVHANDRLAVLGDDGILFTMANLAEAYLVNSTTSDEGGHSVVALEKPDFPIQNIDYSIQQMYAESKIGVKNMDKCTEIMNKSMYDKRDDGSILVHVNGMVIKSNPVNGEVSVDVKPIRMTINTKTLSTNLRTSHIDMAVQERDKCYVKRSDKRIHTSRSGMVVSNGLCTVSMDQFGRILSCS